MGGYSFPGSNSSIDLHFLTGWIPEQLWLKHAGFQREKSWKRLLKGWDQGECLITVGTGKSFGKTSGSRDRRSRDLDERGLDREGRQVEEIQEDGFQLENGIRLVNSHDYAILDVKEVDNRREVTLMNPWRYDLSTQGSTSDGNRVESLSHDVDQLSLNSSQINNSNIFTISWDTLCSLFHSIYLNWKPSLFDHNVTVHSSWKNDRSDGNLNQKTESSSSILGKTISQNPQFRLNIGETQTGSLSPNRNSNSARPSTATSTSTSPSRPSNLRASSTNSSSLSPSLSSSLSITQNPIKEKEREEEIEVWLLLVRHIKQREKDLGKNEFIALHVFEGNEKGEVGARSSVKLVS